MTMQTRVVNISGGEPREGGRYIGRGSVFGNGHPIGRKCPLCSTAGIPVTHDRAGAVKAFTTDFNRRIEYDESYRHAVEQQLPGNLLLCHCAPESCHGDVYIEYLKQQGLLR